MNRFAIAVTLASLAWLATPAAAVTSVSYNTNGSTLSCNGVAGCIQNTTTSVTVGGISLNYALAAGSGVVTPSIISLGSIFSSGTGTAVALSGLLLTINVNSTPPGGSGTLPNGAFSGAISTSSSGSTLSFSPSNITTAFGTLPGFLIGPFTYQVLNPTLGIQAPTVGLPIGLTSIQGAVSQLAAVPEPASWALMLMGFGAVGVARRRVQQKVVA